MDSERLDKMRALGAVHRRAWLAGALWMTLGSSARSQEEAKAKEKEKDQEEEGVKDVEDYAKKQGLRSFHTMRSKHYLAVGNAPNDYLKITLIDCETVALDYMDHFRKKGFELAYRTNG